MKFRKRPIVVDAFQWFLGMNIPWIKEYSGSKMGVLWNGKHDSELEVFPGDWVIDQGGGDRYPCKPDVFEKTYEPVE